MMIIGNSSDINFNMFDNTYNYDSASDANYDSSSIYRDLTKVVVFKDKIGSIGNVKEAERLIDLGSFSVGYTLGENILVQSDEVWIQNGLFKTKMFSRGFEGINPRKALLRFYVNATNNYGNLVIEVNGKEVYRNNTLGWIELVIEDLNKDYNEISIYAESSNMKFWAPTTYQLLNLELIVEDFKDNKVKIPFIIEDYELNGWRNALLKFYIGNSKPNGNLKILINDVPIYSGRPVASSEAYSVDVYKNDVNLKVGENLIEVLVDKDSGDTYYDIASMIMKIYFYGSDSYLEGIRQFDISKRRMLFLNKANTTARLYIYVDSVLLDNGISVEINGKKFESRQVGNKGYIVYDINPNILRNKNNYIKIMTTGAYNIGEVKLVFESI